MAPFSSEAAGKLYRRLRECCPRERPSTARRYATSDDRAWEAKRALDSVIGNFFPGGAGSPRLTPADRARFLRGLPWLARHLAGLRRLRKREGRGSYDARRFRKVHQSWKDERSRLFARAARACAERLPSGRRGAVLVLDDVDGRGPRGGRLRTTEAVRVAMRGLKRRACTVFTPNPNPKICAIARASGSETFCGKLAEALAERRVPKDMVAAYLDYCTGTPAVVIRDLRPLLPLMRRACVVAVTLSGRDSRGGGALSKRLLQIGDELARHGFVAPEELREAMDFDGKVGVLCAFRAVRPRRA